MMKKIAPAFLLLLYFSSTCFGQSRNISLNLKECIQLAQSDAPNILIAKTRMSNNYWRYRSYLANFRPQIDLIAGFPGLNRSIDAITLPDGTETFIPRSYMNNSLLLSLSQDIPLTGGRVSISSGIQRIDIFKTDLVDYNNSYLSSPISFGIQQPLFSYNPYKWAKKLEPLRYQKAIKSYSEDKEEVATQAVNLYFQLLTSQLLQEASFKEMNEAEELYEISKGRFEVGRIAETELLQIELSLRNAASAYQRASLDLELANENLRNFIGIKEEVNFTLEMPFDLLDISLDPQSCIEYAKKNRSDYLDYAERIINSEANLDQAKKNSGINADLNASFGLSQTADQFSNAYNSPLDREFVQIGLNLPIADWGKSEAQREIANSNLELTKMSVEQEKFNFERNIEISINRFNLLRDQVNLSKRAYDVSIKRNEITRARYVIGKIGVTELNLAIDAMESARRSYINSIREYWTAYYNIRSLTLYDFEANRDLVEVDPLSEKLE